MKKPLQNTMIIGTGTIITIALIAWFIITDQTHDPLLPNNRVIVATSIFPLTDIAENIGGQHITVVQLLPSGASPHSYTLTPSQLTNIQNAKALFVIGHNLDTWATTTVTRATNIPTVVVDNNIALQAFGGEHEHEHEDGDEEHEEENHNHDHEAGAIDPHYWLTVPNAQEIAKTIALTLQNADPVHSSYYAQNLQDYLTELDEVEAELQALAHQAHQAEFIAIHDAWRYLADHYGLRLVATYEPVEGREPSIRDIQELQEIITKHNIHTFFTEPQKQSTGAARFLQQDLGLKIKVLDPIGGTKNTNSYVAMMRENIKAIAQ